MSRQKKIEMSALNVVLNPHPENSYRDLILKAHDLDREIRMGGAVRMKLGSMSIENIDGMQYATGYIHRYDSIDIDDTWLNQLTNKEAEPTDLDAVNIPDHLKPHFKYFRYVFLFDLHTIVFERKHTRTGAISPWTLGPQNASKFFKRLFCDNEILTDFSEAEITVIQSKTGLEEIFALPELKTIEIHIKRKNSFSTDIYDHMEKRLKDQNAGAITEITTKSTKADSLNPDKETRVKADMALANGYVTGEGKDEEGIKKTSSTEDSPLIETLRYDPDNPIGYSKLLAQKAQSVMKKFFNL